LNRFSINFNTTSNKRIGALAIKLGSIPQWTKDGKKIYTTLVQILDNHVIDYIEPEVLIKKDSKYIKITREGQFGKAIVGALSTDPRHYSQSYLDQFKNAGIPPKRKLTSFMISKNAAVKPGTPIYASHFRVGDFVDVGAKTLDYGFQGVMKRYGFAGGPRSHGSTKFHRKRGTIGVGRVTLLLLFFF
jgi:large subunit ribosomal protein L3